MTIYVGTRVFSSTSTGARCYQRPWSPHPAHEVLDSAPVCRAARLRQDGCMLGSLLLALPRAPCGPWAGWGDTEGAGQLWIGCAEWCAQDTLGRAWICLGDSVHGGSKARTAWLGAPWTARVMGCEGSPQPCPCLHTPLWRMLQPAWSLASGHAQGEEETDNFHRCPGILCCASPVLAPTRAGCSGECSPSQAVEQAAPQVGCAWGQGGRGQIGGISPSDPDCRTGKVGGSFHFCLTAC